MKKLLLTSNGLRNEQIIKTFLDELSKKVEEINALVVAYAQTQEEEFYVNESKQELLKLGVQTVVVKNINDLVDVDKLPDFDLMYVCGGNTFKILHKLRETRLDVYITKQVEQGALYVGVSAGSIIAGPDIEIAGWGSEGDENEVNLQDLEGFNFTDIAVFPHFHEELRREVEEFRKKVEYRVVELTDEQALIVIDDFDKLVG